MDAAGRGCKPESRVMAANRQRRIRIRKNDWIVNTANHPEFPIAAQGIPAMLDWFGICCKCHSLHPTCRHVMDLSPYQKSIQVFTEIGEAFEDCLTLIDMNEPGRRCIYVNGAFCKTTGYTREEAIGENLKFLQGAETSQRAIIFMRQAFESKDSCCVDIINYRKNGERFLNRLVMLPFRIHELDFMIGFQNEIPTPPEYELQGDGILPVSSGEINHMINSPLTAILLNLYIQERVGKDTQSAIHACRDAFHQINVFCRHIDEPNRFIGYNPFRS